MEMTGAPISDPECLQAIFPSRRVRDRHFGGSVRMRIVRFLGE